MLKLLSETKRYILLITLTIFIVFCTHISSDADENRKPVFSEGARATRTVAENTAPGTNIGAAFTATDPDSGDTLTYSLHRGDRDSFSIDPDTGQLQTRASLDYETKNSYNDLAVRVTDSGGLTDAILVTINVTDVKENREPVFIDGGRAIRTIAENTAAGVNIGAPVAATDADNDVLTYILGWPQESSSFSIDSTTGQIRTKAPLDYETKNVYHFTVFVDDGNGGKRAISVTINVTDVAEITPPLSERTLQVRDGIVAAAGVDSVDDVTAAHLAAITFLNLYDKSISSLKAGDFNGLTALSTLGLTFNSISDISALENLTSLTTLFLHENSISDISALENLTSLIYLSLYNNSISDVSALENLTSLVWVSLTGNPISDYGPLRRLKAANTNVNIIGIDFDNNIPTFTDGESTTRSIAENTAYGENIGNAVAAIDADNDTLTYSLSGMDAASFSIVDTSGQLQTKAVLDYEAKTSYSVTVIVYDGNNGGDRITVTINVTDVAGAAPALQTPPVLPGTTAVLSNFPNPFNPETWIPYQLAEPAAVTITIYDVQGRVVRTLRVGHQLAGFYQSRSKAAHWDGRNQFGEKVATGVYFYTLKAGDYMVTRKLLIRK